MLRIRSAAAAFAAAGLVGLLGCPGTPGVPEATAPRFEGMKVVVGAVGDPAILQALGSQKGEWEATRGAQLVLADKPVDPKNVKGIDLLLFPGDRLGDLVDASALHPLAPSVTDPPRVEKTDDAPPADGTAEPPADPLQFADVLPAFREQTSKYGNERLALPYGGSALVLVYRLEAFESEANRAAAKNAKLNLELPKTWEQLDTLARFFQQTDWNGDGKPGNGIALALGNDPDGLGDATLLARSASVGQHRDQYSFLFDSDTMAPRIDSPPFVESLRGLVALGSAGPEGMSDFDAEAARKAFREGKTALLIDRAERASTWGGDKPIGVAPLPGSERVYDPSRSVWESVSSLNQPSYLPVGGGWLAGIVASADERHREAATDLARFLIGPEVSNRVRAERAFPMLPVRAAQLIQGLPDSRSAPSVDPRRWSDAVGRTLQAARMIPGLRIPEAQGYLADLSTGRAAAAHGEPAERALKAVAEAWTARTKKLGVERQLWHYKRSLNSLVTTPEPPAR